MKRDAILAKKTALMHLNDFSITKPFILVGLFGWVPIEIVAKRLVKAELAVVAGGSEASNKLLVGAIVQLVLILTIFLAMQHKV